VTAVHAYPTPAHERAAEAITGFFALREETDAVLLTNSCARGNATPDSCLDMQNVVSPRSVERLDAAFRAFAAGDEAVAGLATAGRYSDLHLDVVGGVLEPGAITEEGSTGSR
jgi:hypothetical protein